MADVAKQSVGWLVLAAIVLAIIVAKRRTENKYAAAVSAARAEGHAEAVAALSAQQHVNVAVDASNRGAGDHECLDPFTCSICAPALLRIVRAYRGAGIAGSSWTREGDDYNEHDDAAASYEHVAALDVGRRGEPGAVLGIDGGGAAGGGGAGDRAGASRGVEGVPDAELRPELLADMLRRPWAYDEADRRFGLGVPVANGRRGRGPGR